MTGKRVFCSIVFILYYLTGNVEAKSKQRTVLRALKEVKTIETELLNSSDNTTGENLQWIPSVANGQALTNDEDIKFGILPDTPLQRGIALPPEDRVPAPKPDGAGLQTRGGGLPKEYNAQDVYLKECPSFNHIMFQGKCGNCWAVAVTAMINDRVCMYKPAGEKQRYFSARHLTTCLQKGCDGGWFVDALTFWRKEGMITGGDYRMSQTPGCIPYPTDTETMIKGSCPEKCKDGTSVDDAERSYGSARYTIKSQNVTEIMEEIYLYGPVIATFDVYPDFAHYYTKGIYRKASKEKKLGSHAAKLYGWGEERGVKFWYATNSWGKTWGDKGFFKIQRGTNEVNIESNVHAAVPAEALTGSRANDIQAEPGQESHDDGDAFVDQTTTTKKPDTPKPKPKPNPSWNAWMNFFG